MRLEQIMAVNVATIFSTDSIARAACEMKERNVGCLVVIDGSEVRGMITDRDIATRCTGEEHDARGCRVFEHMSGPAIVATPTMDVLEAAHLMTTAQIKRLPIVVNNRLVGLVSFSDVALALDKAVHDLLLGMGGARRAVAA